MTTEYQPQQTVTETTTMKQQVATDEELIDGLPREQWLAKWSETSKEKIVDGMPAEKWLAIRKEAGLKIDPETAEVCCVKSAHIDPYGIYPELREYESCIGREYFASSPGSDIWVVFGDLPEATSAALSEKLRAPKAAEPQNAQRSVDRRYSISQNAAVTRRDSRRTGSSCIKETDEALYREIINFVSDKPHNLKRFSTDLIKAEIADRYILKFPELALEENKDALKFILDCKYSLLESVILAERDFAAQLDDERMNRLRVAQAKLKALGLLPYDDDLPF